MLHHDGVIVAGNGHAQETGFSFQFIQVAACGGADADFGDVIPGGLDLDVADNARRIAGNKCGTSDVCQCGRAGKHDRKDQDKAQQFLQINHSFFSSVPQWIW